MKSIPRKSHFNFGFTLVELMVVISIIGILSAIVYASFGDSRKIARDDIRKTDLKNLQVAIELYKAQNGRYPNACRGTLSSGGLSGAYVCPIEPTAPPTGGCLSDYICNLTPDFITALPYDTSAGNSKGYIYRVNGAGTEYKLMSYQAVEKKLVADCSSDYARYPTGNTNCTDPLALLVQKTYAVYKSAGPANCTNNCAATW